MESLWPLYIVFVYSSYDVYVISILDYCTHSRVRYDTSCNPSLLLFLSKLLYHITVMQLTIRGEIQLHW